MQYLGPQEPARARLREVRDRESGALLNGIRQRLEALLDTREDALGRSRARPAPARGGDRRHAARARSCRSGISTRSPRCGGRSRTRSSASATRCATTARSRRVEYNFDKLAFAADAPGALTARHVLLRREARPAHRDEPVADPRARGAPTADLHGLDRARLPPRCDHGDALPDLPPVRRARRRSRDHARRPQGNAAARDARAVRRRSAACASGRTSSPSPSRRSSRTSPAGSAAARAAAPASSRAGSRWAAPAWSIRGVFENVGLDPDEWGGFAFGCGLERTAQLRHDIPDIARSGRATCGS